MTMAFPPNMQQLLDDARSLSQLVAMQDKLTVDSTWELHQTADHQWYASRKVLGSSRLHILSLRPNVLKALEDVRDWNKVQRTNAESLIRIGDFDWKEEQRRMMEEQRTQQGMQEDMQQAQQTQTLGKGTDYDPAKHKPEIEQAAYEEFYRPLTEHVANLGCATPPVTEQEEQPYHTDLFDLQCKLAEQRVAAAERSKPGPMERAALGAAKIVKLNAPSHTEPKTAEPQEQPKGNQPQ